VDVWWGSYAGREMLPSFVVCLLATGVIAWLVWRFFPPGERKLAFVGLAGLVWLIQGVRWGRRYFGMNYRMTNRRLFHLWGFLDSTKEQVELANVSQVLVRSNWYEKMVGVGQVILLLDNAPQKSVILKGVKRPGRVAEKFRVWVKQARETPKTSP
jgi:hypothetical protein